jgi:hypothetical protein
MSKSQKILACASLLGIAAADKRAKKMGLCLFAVDAGPGSRVEVWNGAWNRMLARGFHISTYKP